MNLGPLEVVSDGRVPEGEAWLERYGPDGSLRDRVTITGLAEAIEEHARRRKMERPIGWRRVTDGATPPPGIAAALDKMWGPHVDFPNPVLQLGGPGHVIYLPGDDIYAPIYAGDESAPDEAGPSEPAAVTALRDLVAAVREWDDVPPRPWAEVVLSVCERAEAVLEGQPAPTGPWASEEERLTRQAQGLAQTNIKLRKRAEAAEAECAGLREQLEAKGDATHSRRPDGFYYCHGYYRDGYFKPGDCNCPICLSQRLEEQVEVNRVQAAANLEAIREASEPLRFATKEEIAASMAAQAKSPVGLFEAYEAAERKASAKQQEYEAAAERACAAREDLLAALGEPE